MKENFLLDKTKEFWDSNPCDGNDDIRERVNFKYSKDPWMPAVLTEVAKNKNILEVGCGQGTDTLYCCKNMKKGGKYTAIDLSPKSIEKAMETIQTFKDEIKVIPEMKTGNAESLAFADNSFDCIYSCGVLHHSPNTEKAIDELYRVLKKGGTAYVILYRIYSPKLLAAYLLRFVNSLFSLLTLNRINFGLYISRKFQSSSLGTLLHECFGVPILRSYSASGMRKRFENFSQVKVEPIGGLGLPSKIAFIKNNIFSKTLSYLWLIKAVK